MNPIHLDVPGAEIIFNELYETSDPGALRQDLVSIKLLDGTFIDVGWYPQFEPAGCFKVTQYDSLWERPIQVFKTRDVNEVVKIVQWIDEVSREKASAQPASCTLSHSHRVAEMAGYPQSFAISA
jgi:hypothetical protein